LQFIVKMIRILKGFTRKVQYRIILGIIIVGTLSYIFDRYSGPGATAPSLEDGVFPMIIHRITFVCVIILLLFPLFGIIREKILIKYFCRYIEKSCDSNSLSEICKLFELDPEVLKRTGFPEVMQKKDIKRLIERYLIESQNVKIYLSH